MSAAEPVGLSLGSPLFAVFAALFGAVTGSFLNAVIHRLPRGISLSDPRRSFCPACQSPIPWRQNIPVVSWLLLRGRCARCGAPIPARYFFVEILTAALFAGLWAAARADVALALGLFVFCGIAVAASFIDLEHMIIPDSLTLGGAAAGLVFSVAAPALQRTTDRFEAAGWSLAGMLAGAAVLWVVVEAGKLAFGKARVGAGEKGRTLPFELEAGAGGAALVLNGERHALEETFSRESDRIEIQAARAVVNGRVYEAARITLRWNRVETPGGVMPLESVRELRGEFTEAVLPREAMGLGDVKFMAAIGAFFGWQGALFSLVTGSVAGAAVGGVILAARRRGGIAIPFGPFLAAGALLWAFCGPAVVDWYFGRLMVPRFY